MYVRYLPVFKRKLFLLIKFEFGERACVSPGLGTVFYGMLTATPPHGEQ